MPSGPNQHYLPRFLQRPFGTRPKRKSIWVFARGAGPEAKTIKEVGASEHFYSDPPNNGERTLDDEITDIENVLSKNLAVIRGQHPGTGIDAAIAAEIVDHLVPRTAHVRINIERGLRVMSEGVEMILSDEKRVQSLIGLDEDEPGEAFRKNFSERLNEIEGIENLGVPEHVIQRVAFFQAKENFSSVAEDTLPTLQKLFSSWLQANEGIVRESHNKIVKAVSASTPRLKLLENLKWTVDAAPPEGVILPDCAAVGIDSSGHAAPAMFVDLREVAAIILPIAPDKLLIGASRNCEFAGPADFNEDAARCSHDFFLAPTKNDCLTGLQELIGERSTKLVEDGVGDALAPHLVPLPECSEKDAPAFPVDLIKPSDEPWQYELTLIGCGDADEAQSLVTAIKSVVSSIARAVPLQRLDGITVASDYPGAVASVDRGYDHEADELRNAPEEIGRGIARTISVRRDDRWKERIVIDAGALFAILADDSDTVDWGVFTLVRQLMEVGIPEIIERDLPGIWMAPVKDPLQGFLYSNIHPAIFAYLTSHISAGFGDAPRFSAEKRQLLTTALGVMTSTGLAERLDYRYHGDLDRLLETVMPRISYVLQFAAELLGHCAALGEDPLGDSDELSAALADTGLTQWFPVFGDRLEQFRMRLGRWESFDEFLALNIHVERLMWQLGMLPWLGPKGIRIEIPLGTDIEKLLEATKN